MNKIEKRIAYKLIDSILEAGYKITVNDEEDMLLGKSSSREAVMAELGASEYNWLNVFDKVAGVHIGGYMLVWGNEDDLISDAWTKTGYDDIIEKIDQKVM